MSEQIRTWIAAHRTALVRTFLLTVAILFGWCTFAAPALASPPADDPTSPAAVQQTSDPFVSPAVWFNDEMLFWWHDNGKVYTTNPAGREVPLVEMVMGYEQIDRYVFSENGVVLGEFDHTMIYRSFTERYLFRPHFTVGYHTVDLTIYEPNGNSSTGSMTFEVVLVSSLPPGAGYIDVDLVYSFPNYDRYEWDEIEVLFDGRAVSDQFGEIVRWDWEINSWLGGDENRHITATGPTPTVYLAAGYHTFRVTITDVWGRTDYDNGYFGLQPAPRVDAGPDITITTYNDSADVTMDATITYSHYHHATCQYWAVFSWYNGETRIRYHNDLDVTQAFYRGVFNLPVGTHHLRLEVRPGDGDCGATGEDTLTVTIVKIPPNPRVTLSKASGTIYSGITATLSGFPRGAIEVFWTSPDGATTAQRVAATSAGANGTATASFNVPETTGGAGHTLRFVHAQTSVQTTFEVLPEISGGSWQPGWITYISFSGFPANRTYVMEWKLGNEWIPFGDAETDELGSGTGSGNAPIWAANGPHTIRIGTVTGTATIFGSTGPPPPRIDLFSAGSTVGSKISVTVTGFPGNANVTVTWLRANGTVINGLSLPVIRTNGGGSATAEFPVPAVPGGWDQAIRFTSGAISITKPINIVPKITASVAQASPGQSITLNLRGLSANGGYTIMWKVGASWVNVGSATSSNSGSITNLVVVTPANAPTGPATISAIGAYGTTATPLTIVAGSSSNANVTITPFRTTVNNKVTFTVSGFPANSDVAITWRRLSGSSIDIATVRTDANGFVSGYFKVPATTGGPGQQITFQAGSVSRTAPFELAPRVKSNTSPGLRGQAIDFSLRGFAKQESIRIRWWNPNTSKWVDVATGQTSNTGSANIPIVVPSWAADGEHKVRAETASFNQQTNVVLVAGGARVTLAEVEATPTPEPTETPTPEPTAEPEASPESSETPTPEPTVDPEVTPEPTLPTEPVVTPTPETPEAVEPEPTPSPEPPAGGEEPD